jgi:GNAT superfamily N-acetyltransferase
VIFEIRPAKQRDEDTIFSLLQALAEYERLTDKFKITREIILRDYLCERPMLNCDLAFADAKPVGIASWYWTYSSFAAKRALFLEDLFVLPEERGHGYGKALLAHLARTAVRADAVRVEWEVLDWNEPSIRFYESIGARKMTDWFVFQLSGDAMKKLGDA